ncbi:MAG: hypothetical protein ACREBS_06670 [Nitrososphaerales archaeon]
MNSRSLTEELIMDAVKDIFIGFEHLYLSFNRRRAFARMRELKSRMGKTNKVGYVGCQRLSLPPSQEDTLSRLASV